jgi:hypothetical protein
MPFDNPRQPPFGDIELLWDARSRIGRKGDWVQGRFQDGNRHCLVAALSLAAGSASFNMPNRLERRLARLVATNLPSRLTLWARLRCFTARQRLMWFNDDPRTRHQDVLGVLDTTIDRLASRVPVSVSA